MSEPTDESLGYLRVSWRDEDNRKRGKVSASVVAQIVNLPYRRLLIGTMAGGRMARGLAIRATADCQSALRPGGVEK